MRLLAGTVLAWSAAVSSAPGQTHWAFLPLRRPAPPEIRETGRAGSDVDRFIVAALEEEDLRLSAPADARVLARRLFFDLLGLPPAPEEVEAFVAASARDRRGAAAALVDRLLASPHYGERWARHWLDVARYADSDGQEGDADRPHAYRYRDAVIRAFNEDVPFDTFVRWQLAGDEIEPANPDAVAATGFMVAGTHADLSAVPMEEEKVRERFNELDDMLATTGSAMLGLTLACARCHDHKFDPVPQADYYRMLRVFNGGDRAVAPLAPPEDVRAHADAESRWKEEMEAVERDLRTMAEPWEEAVRLAKIEALPASPDEKEVLARAPASAEGKAAAKRHAARLRADWDDYQAFLPEESQAGWDARVRALRAVQERRPAALPVAYVFRDFGSEPRETRFLERGDFKRPGEPVDLGFLGVLTRGRPAAGYWEAVLADRRRSGSTQQRRALAEWMTDVEEGAGALLARVIVNRVWLHHFGEGLVRTANDFGTRGDPPTHPALLEWLAAELVRGGWKLKTLHRLILNSEVYLQGGEVAPAAEARDPENRLLWRQRPRRLEPEILRDAVLAVSGRLNPEMFGPAFKAPIATEAIQARNMKDPYPKDLADTPATHRRSVYMFHKRVVPAPLMQAFDRPDGLTSCGKRVITTVAPQALALLNDPFLRARAGDLAERLAREAGEERAAQVRLAWRLGLSRDPTVTEEAAAFAYLHEQERRRAERVQGGEAAGSRHEALTDFCQALFAMNAFLYVD